MADPERDERSSAPTVVQGKGARSSPSVPDHDPEAAPAPSASAFDPPSDRFETRGELGRGGMGRVDEAYDRALGRPVALKHMLSTSEVDLARFEREARITAGLEHPGIVPIHDAGRTADGTPYYVMRRIDGQPLDELVDGKPFAERLALVPNLLAACDAAAYAHARNVIHRDIKPTNILVGPFGETLLIDWGLARTIGEAADSSTIPTTDPNLTRAGIVAGTPGFMAPEQARGEELDTRVDVFALGATLFYVLSGQLPYAVAGATEMIDHAGADRPPDWRRIPDDTPADLRAIVVKAMAADRRARYPDGAALAADLRRFVSGQLVGAHRYGTFEQIVRWIRRHKAALSVAALAAIVIAVGGVLAVRRIITERDDARTARDDATHARLLAEEKRREAMAKSELLVVQTAFEHAEKDPVSTVAALRTLPADSTQWGDAYVAALAAYAKGIPFGFQISGVPDSLEFSPDSRFLAMTTLRGTTIDLFDLHTRTRTQLDVGTSIMRMAWIDPTTLAATTATTIELVDRVTGARRTIPVPELSWQHHLRSSEGTTWLATDTGDIYRLTSGMTALPAPEITRAKYYRALTRGRAAYLKDKQVTLVEPTGRHVLALGGAVDHLAIKNDQAIVWRGKVYCVWNLQSVPEKRQCSEGGEPLMATIVGDAAYVFEPEGFFGVLADGRRFKLGEVVSPFYETPHGFAVGNSDGSWSLRDGHEFMYSGPRVHRYGRMALSLDQQFLAVTTTTAELLVWDLSYQARRVAIPKSDRFVGLGERSIYTLDTREGVYRTDIRTGARELLLAGRYVNAKATYFDTWVVAERADASMVLFELRSRRTVELPARTEFTTEGQQIYTSSGTSKVTEHDRSGERAVGAFPAAVADLAVAAPYLGASLVDSQVCRMAIATGEATCIPSSEPIGQLLVTPTGRVIFYGGKTLYFWDPGSAPRPVDSIDAPVGLTWSGDRPIVMSTHAVQDLGTDPPHVIAIPPMQHFVAYTTRMLVGVTPDQRIVGIDLSTGKTITLPLTTEVWGASITTDGRSVAAQMVSSTIVDKQDVLVWQPTIPVDPTALRAWLGTITNAKQVPGSEAVSWP